MIISLVTEYVVSENCMALPGVYVPTTGVGSGILTLHEEEMEVS